MTHERGKALSGPLYGPSAVISGAILAGLLALVLRYAAPTFLVPLRVVLIVGALIAAGVSVWWRLSFRGEKLLDRLWSAAIVVAAAAVILDCREAMDKDWDSLRMALLVFNIVALGGAGVVLLPSILRRVAATLLLLFHFGGILTAVTAVAPHNGAPAPYLPTAIWSLVYRGYLQFAYLNNAYHFYSPEPGPPTLVWFRVEFEDGSPPYWVRLAEHDQFSTRLQYQRMLALTESTNEPGPVVDPILFELLYERRRVAGMKLDIPAPRREDAPNHYRETTDLTKVYLSSYVRHVARTVREEKNPDVSVERIHVYRLGHRIISAPELEGKQEPLDKSFYTPYFLGEFKPDGTRVVADVIKLGKTKIELYEPFTNWYLPIYRDPLGREVPPDRWMQDTVLRDMLEKHIQSLSRKRPKGNG